MRQEFVDDPQAIRDAAEEVLAHPDFNPSESWLGRLWDWFVSLFEGSEPSAPEIVTPPPEVATGGGGIGIVPILILIGLVALLVVIIARTRWSSVKRVRGDDDDDEIIIRTGEIVDPNSLLGQAERAEGEGRWREALRLRYRALVADLIARGAVDAMVGRTTGEYRREVAGSLPDRSDAFSRASDLFDDVWYGNKPTGEQDSRAFRTLVDEVTR